MLRFIKYFVVKYTILSLQFGYEIQVTEKTNLLPDF